MTSRTHSAPTLVDHLFRREAGKMISYLTKIFGMGRLNLAEDVVQDTLCQALQVWPVQGIPDNPSAWLMRCARNRAVDLIRRDDKLRHLTPELTQLLQRTHDASEDAVLHEKQIQDDQLRMMLSCCHPGLSTELQVTLILKTLCGFSVAEIASALLVQEDAIEKRLGRARKLLRDAGTFVEISDADQIPERLEALHQALYLLFNEGYHGSHAQQTVREELCHEAIRLASLLSEHSQAAQPKTFALLALFCFHAARLAGRLDAQGLLVQLENQDRSTWDGALIAKGFSFLAASAAERELTPFHLEAAIAAQHSAAASYAQTNWLHIERLYDSLYQLTPTAIVALNHAIAVGQAHGAKAGLRALAAIRDSDKLDAYPFYPAARAEFHRLLGELREARRDFHRALELARNPAETEFLQRKLKACLD